MLSENLRRHFTQLCAEPRVPQSPAYFRAQNYIEGELRSMGYAPNRKDFNVLMVGTCTNIYAEHLVDLSRPRILIGAHYDTRKSSGIAADDNTSGVAVTLELARQLRTDKKSNFIFAFFDMEEIIRLGSLRGSRSFVESYPLRIDRAIILDTIGGALAPGFENIYLQFGTGLQSPSYGELEFLHLPMRVLEPMGKSFARSDYDAFRRKNIPYSFITSGTPWYYHTPSDTLEVLRMKKMEDLTLGLIKAFAEARTTHEPALESLKRFLSLLQAIPELNSPKIERMLAKKELPSRWEIIQLYAHVLPRMRKAGPSLWNANGSPSFIGASDLIE